MIMMVIIHMGTITITMAITAIIIHIVTTIDAGTSPTR
jgi:hypothetical protein